MRKDSTRYRTCPSLQPAGTTRQLDVFGVPLSLFDSYQSVEELICQRIREGRRTFCVAINPEKIHLSQKNPEIKTLLNSADIHICDGIGAAWAVRLLHGVKIARITGIQLFFNLMARAQTDGLGVFLLGASPTSNAEACRRLTGMYPGLRIAGSLDGYFRDDAQVVKRINESGADMLFVALGSPRQERWIAAHRDTIEAPYCMGVGGTFDVVSGRAKRAPKFFRATGTEFLYRLLRDPRRIRRQMVLPMFAFHVLVAAVKRTN